MIVISIHAPREGGDFSAYFCCSPSCSFQSTPPARGATGRIAHGGNVIGISIHAPREGGDASPQTEDSDQSISIHAPREGGDDVFPGGRGNLKKFQSTPPARGATSSSAPP